MLTVNAIAIIFDQHRRLNRYSHLSVQTFIKDTYGLGRVIEVGEKTELFFDLKDVMDYISFGPPLSTTRCDNECSIWADN